MALGLVCPMFFRTFGFRLWEEGHRGEAPSLLSYPGFLLSTRLITCHVTLSTWFSNVCQVPPLLNIFDEF